MTVAELIHQLQAFQTEHGNLEVLVFAAHEGAIVNCPKPTVEVHEEGEFPSSWNMPPKFVQIKSG